MERDEPSPSSATAGRTAELERLLEATRSELAIARQRIVELETRVSHLESSSPPPPYVPTGFHFKGGNIDVHHNISIGYPRGFFAEDVQRLNAESNLSVGQRQMTLR